MPLYEVKIIADHTTFIQTVTAESEIEALKQIGFAIFECFDEYVLTVRKIQPITFFEDNYHVNIYKDEWIKMSKNTSKYKELFFNLHDFFLDNIDLFIYIGKELIKE